MNYLKDIPMFSTMSQQDQENLSDFCQIQTLIPKQVLFSQGDEAHAFYIIQSGNLDIYKRENENNKVIATLGFGDIVGEMSFFGHPPVRNATVVAVGETRLITLLHFSLSEILKKYPNIHQDLQYIIEKRTQKNT